MESHTRVRMTVQLILGLVILCLGILFTLDNLHVLAAREYLRYWPVVFVAIGVAQVAQARSSARVVGGGIWILFGGALLGRQIGFLPENIRDYWPMVLVLLGGYVVWQSFNRPLPSADGTDGPVVSAIAILGGLNRKVSSTFRGAELTAFMGGGKLDLREATLGEGENAVIDVFALMGGFEILIPETWSVRTEVIPFMGGVDDKTRVNSTGAAPLVIIRGFVMWGGIDIKNRDKKSWDKQSWDHRDG